MDFNISRLRRADQIMADKKNSLGRGKKETNIVWASIV